ncbi:hypothetical protein L1987_47874 [Smallanthus sonchifolius]|uniref:Uncharacterized protein n=1 Tax=Smallanthus sonchifolius TaxID=185202 RepID=A0ACB9FPQ2_9ASTR|nr:hypothetical protein L1987_47874 [Smallanthus sonchifolius]
MDNKIGKFETDYSRRFLHEAQIDLVPLFIPLQRNRLKAMATSHDQVGVEEDEYVVLDLDAVSEQIGEYEETLGSCNVLSETDAPPDVHEETGPSEANLFSGLIGPLPQRSFQHFL